MQRKNARPCPLPFLPEMFRSRRSVMLPHAHFPRSERASPTRPSLWPQDPSLRRASSSTCPYPPGSSCARAPLSSPPANEVLFCATFGASDCPRRGPAAGPPFPPSPWPRSWPRDPLCFAVTLCASHPSPGAPFASGRPPRAPVRRAARAHAPRPRHWLRFSPTAESRQLPPHV